MRGSEENHKSNQRLWTGIHNEQEAAASRGCKGICKNVKSHNTEAMLKGEMDEIEWFGNVMADSYAGEYVGRVVLGVGPRAEIAVIDATRRLILARRVAIYVRYVAHFPQDKKERERAGKSKPNKRYVDTHPTCKL